MNITILINGFFPILLIILIGYFLKKKVITSEEQWQGLERISFYILMPMILIRTLGKTDFQTIQIGGVTITLISSVILIFLFLILFYPLTKKLAISKSTYTTIFQVSSRWNGFIAIGIIYKLYGDKGIEILSFAILILVPFISTVNVIMIVSVLKQGTTSYFTVLKHIFINPLLIGCFLGLIIGTFKIELWYPLESVIDIFSDAALGILLLSVGSYLSFSKFKGSSLILLLSCLSKVLFLPLIAVMIASFVGLNQIAFITCIVVVTVPAAASGVILAKQYGGDAILYSNAVTIQVFLSLISIPFWILISEYYFF